MAGMAGMAGMGGLGAMGGMGNNKFDPGVSDTVHAGAHKRKERSAAIYPNVNSAARCARRVSDDVYYQQSKESDVGSLAHAQQSSQSR